jgi:hypothetical protein
VASSSTQSGGTPRRLLHQAGKWILEVVRHVNVGHDLIRPTTQRLTGQRAIASYFKNNPDKALLAKATQRLMQGELGAEPRSYNVEGGEWIANSTPPPRQDTLDSYRSPPDPPTLETEMGELKAQVVMLSAVQEGLLIRLARLEAKLADGHFVTGPAARAARVDQPLPSADDELGDDGSASGGAEDGEDGDPEDRGADEAGRRSSKPVGSKAPIGEAAAPEPIGSGEAPPEPVPEAPAEPAAPARLLLTLPPVPELAKCISLLVGGDMSAKEGEPLAVNRTIRDCYASAILDDNDQTVGLILMDLRATVYLGGTLMMLPKSELEQQLKAVTPGEDSIAASAEICNALSGAINGAQGQHVRVGRLEKFEFRNWSWVTEPSDRRDLEDSFGGRTVVFSRPLPTQIF